MWDPEVYGTFADERSRPFVDLVARVGARDPRFVVDLGCGDGSLTATLAARWPGASVVGVDSSASMLSGALTGGEAAAGGEAAGAAAPGLEFRLGRIEDWVPERPVDVLVSNAALQWVPSHLELLPRLVGALAPGGWLAFQVPGNWSSPSHTILADLRSSPRWAARLADADRGPGAADPVTYLRALAGLGCAVDAWETTYVHVLTGADPVLRWVRGTALRPVLDRLTAEEAAEFEAEYGQRLRLAYPPEGFGTALPFRRVFAVARAPR
jgi:trans-aconitate 2-methyltransferase